MGYKVEKLDGEPIVLVRVFGTLTLSEQAGLILAVARLIENIPGKIYRVVDATGKMATFADMIAMTSQELKGWAGSASDPRVITLAALDNSNTLIAARVLQRTLAGQNKMHTFNTLTEALTCAREMIAAEVENATG